MKPLLFDTYEFHSDIRIWRRPDFAGIAYSDGDEIEQRIFSAIDGAKDVGLFSKELAAHCTDWPSIYHLSPIRSNILRPFEEKLRGKKVLEIGAGCGAITRYLADIDCTVVALEGSTRRCSIARTRVRDAAKVQMVCDSFAQFQCNEKFDFVTLIGVLEYAPKFIGGDTPVQSMLQRALALLAPSGTLLIAIENKLGLKYFAGASEDHLGVPMYGIEGLYKAGEPETFGRLELQEKLRAAGFHHAQFYFPFPDYKFPTSVISPAAQACSKFDASAIAIASAHKDVQLPRIRTLSPELAWPTVCANGLFADLANSFLVAASCDSQTLNSDVVAWHYSLERREAYQKVTTFHFSESAGVSVTARQLHPGSTDRSPALHQNLIWAPYLTGDSLHQKMVTLLAYHGWRLEQLGDLLRPYLGHLLNSASCSSTDASGKLAATLPGGMIDCIPQNVMVSPGGSLIAFDQEWALDAPVSVERILFRSALAIAGSISRVSRCADMYVETPQDLFKAVLRALDFPDTTSNINELLRLESEFQQMVTDKPTNLAEVREWYTTYRFPHDPMQRAYAIDIDELGADLKSAHAAQDVSLQEIQGLKDQRDQLTALNESNVQKMASLTHDLLAVQTQLDAIKGSTSWRALSPVRKLLSVFRR